jgi:hypothetical protein
MRPTSARTCCSVRGLALLCLPLGDAAIASGADAGGSKKAGQALLGKRARLCRSRYGLYLFPMPRNPCAAAGGGMRRMAIPCAAAAPPVMNQPWRHAVPLLRPWLQSPRQRRASRCRCRYNNNNFNVDVPPRIADVQRVTGEQTTNDGPHSGGCSRSRLIAAPRDE